MARIRPVSLLLIAVPATAAIIVAVVMFLRDDGVARDTRVRQRAELDRVIEAERVRRSSDPASAIRAFREAQAPAAAASAVDPKASRLELLRQGDRAIPAVKAAIYDSREAPMLRLELVGLLADFRTPAADATLLEVLGDQAVEERFRAVALGKLAGRPVENAWPVLKGIFEEEPSFSNRVLLLKAIGETRHADVTPLLIRAAAAEVSAVGRIQALDSLATRTSLPEVMQAVRTRLLEDSEPNVRLAALSAVGKSKESEADALLTRIVENSRAEDSLRKAAMSWIEKRKKQQ